MTARNRHERRVLRRLRRLGLAAGTVAASSAALGLLSLPQAHAAQLVCPPPVASTITVDQPSTIAAGSSCEIEASGSVLLTNTGSLRNEENASLSVAGEIRLAGSGDKFSNAGSLTVTGFTGQNEFFLGNFRNEPSGFVRNKGTFEISAGQIYNYGTFVNERSLQESSLYGLLRNYATLTNTKGGTIGSSPSIARARLFK